MKNNHWLDKNLEDNAILGNETCIVAENKFGEFFCKSTSHCVTFNDIKSVINPIAKFLWVLSCSSEEYLKSDQKNKLLANALSFWERDGDGWRRIV